MTKWWVAGRATCGARDASLHCFTHSTETPSKWSFSNSFSLWFYTVLALGLVKRSVVGFKLEAMWWFESWGGGKQDTTTGQEAYNLQVVYATLVLDLWRNHWTQPRQITWGFFFFFIVGLRHSTGFYEEPFTFWHSTHALQSLPEVRTSPQSQKLCTWWMTS